MNTVINEINSTLGTATGTLDTYLNTQEKLAINNLEHMNLENTNIASYAVGTVKTGTSSVDSLYAISGVDDYATLNGLGGDDSLLAEANNVQLNGGDGDDFIQTQSGSSNSILHGNNGHDILNSYSGTDNKLYGDAGNDTLQSTSDNTALYGGSGNDTLTVYGGTGNFILDGGTGADTYRIQSSGTYTVHIDNLDDYVVYQSNTSIVNLVISVDNYKVPSENNFNSVTYVNGAKALDYHIDSVDAGLRFGFLKDKFLGYHSDEGITLKYGFATSADHNESGFSLYTQTQKADIAKCLEAYTSTCNIQFVEVNDLSQADFKFYLDDLTVTNTAPALNKSPHYNLCTCSGCAFKEIQPKDDDTTDISAEADATPNYITTGYAWYGGDVHLNSSLYSDDDAFEKTDSYNGYTLSGKGSGYDTVLHEVGHVLGLKHTGNYSNNNSGPYLSTSEENKDFSIMSYKSSSYDKQWDNQGLQDFDLATLHYKFGVNESARSGNNRYDMTNTMYIWDGNGIDTITAQSATAGVMVDLAPGSWNYVGTKAELLSAEGQSFLGFDTHIENALGSQFSDKLNGNTSNNTLQGYAGDDVLYGLDGNDKLYGGNGNDSLYGGNQNDYLNGGAGADKQYGQSGDDTLYGLDGNDSLYGGAGNDILLGGNQNDYLHGANGDDRLYGGTGNDIMHGLNDNDYLRGDDGDDKLYGGLGSDTLAGGNDNDYLRGDDGNDKLYGGLGDDILYGMNDNDYLKGENGNDKLYGGLGDDTLLGGNQDDYLNGAEGKDRLYGGSGSDILYGLDDNDYIRGDDGNDKLYGGLGHDTLAGGNHDDYLDGAEGNDRLYAGSGNDTVYGRDGNDYIKGENGNDTLNGGSGTDTLVGGNNDDNLHGEDGNDKLFGGSGNDKLYAGKGNDYLRGDDGSDRLYGDSGRDILYGGTGNDIFDFNAITDSTLNLKDVITDFTRGEDKIDLSGIDANTSASGNQAFTSIIEANESFSQAGQLQLKNGVLYGNNDADAQADFAIEVKNINGLTLNDFVL